MTFMHQVVGYDRDTERVGLEYGIPQQDFDKIKQIVGVASSDPDAVGNYEIDGATRHQALRLLPRARAGSKAVENASKKYLR
jgi:hypothetical protein